MFFAVKDGEALYSQQEQDMEMTVAQIMSSLLQNSVFIQEIGKTTKQLGYDLNQICYDYTLNEMNRFKGLVLLERVPGM